MTNTGYPRTSAFPQRYRANLPERHASRSEWEALEIFEVTPPTAEPWHAGVYCTADVDTGTVGQLRLRSSSASGFTVGATDYFNDFDTVGSASVLGTEWEVYDSVGNAGFGLRRPAQVAVVSEATATSNGKCLRITAQNVSGAHHSGGVKLKVPKTYGQYEIRVRCSDDASAVTSGVVLLWPESNVWPRDGEIDWWETFNNRTTRTPVQSYVHRLAADGVSDETVVGYDHTGVDQSDWHKIVCTWVPDKLSISIDNGSEVVLTSDPAEIPDWPMELCLQLDAWSNTPPGSPVTMDIDYVLIRDVSVAAVSPAVDVIEFTRNVRLGFQGIPAGAQLLYVEGRRQSGTGGVRLIQAKPTILSAPPAGLITGSLPAGGSSGGGSGGGTVTATDVVSTFVSDTESTTFTILPSWFSPAVQPGQRVVLIGAAPGPSDVSSFSWTAFPGSFLTSASGGTYNPRVMCTVVDYNAAGWTVTASASFRVAGICLANAVGLAASTPVQGFSPANPGSVAHAANAVGLAVNVLNFTTATISAPTTSPGTHTTVIDKSAVPRQIHVAKIARPTAGTYDPGTATAGPGSEESTVFAIAAQPTANSTFPGAPTVPAFSATVTLSTLSADIAAAVAAQPPGTHFQLVSGTYTNWSNVRPKTGMHFKGPASGTATLEGTGKTWAFRAIDATGSSDNVTISGPVGSIKIQNYGAGTTRAEYGAIQAQPTDTSVGSTEFTYGTAQGWFIQGVELSKNGAQGIRVSDYFTLYQVTSYGHTVSNVGGDRGVGGLIHSCTFDAGGLNPATGVNSNGAGVKFTFWNASEGRSQVVPSGALRSKAPMKVVSTNFTATHAGVTGTGNIGLWFDLDCQQIEIYGGTFTNHPWCGIVVEGCNNVYMTGFTIDNSDGYGATNGEDFILGGLTIAESTNVTVESYTITNSDRALIVRQSNRSGDWFNSNNGSFVNYAWPTSSGGVRYWLTADGPLPIPAVSDRANMWSGNITLRSGTFTSCSKVMLSEGTNGGGMSTAGSIPLNSIRFEGNNYAGSSGILFYDRSTTGINLAAWQALPFKRDN